MRIRAIIIGLALGLGISAFTYFNDAVIRQTWFINNHLPLSVFGAVVLLLLAVNPLLRLIPVFGPRMPLSAGEIAVITALALAACGWPSFNFYWGFIPSVAMPSQLHKNAPHWQSNHVMSYVPGGSALLGSGHVRDWPGLATQLISAEPGSPQARWWSVISASNRGAFEAVVEAGHADNRQASAMLGAMNTALARRDVYDPEAFSTVEAPPAAVELLDRLQSSTPPELSNHEVVARNRWLLTASFPDLVLAPPRGEGALLAGGRGDARALDMIVRGNPSGTGPTLKEMPWETWWPTLRVWGGLGMLLALASLCLALIVHHQWSAHEMLPYPVARFVEEISQRENGAWLPNVARNRLFWTAFLAVVVIHSANGLHSWFPLFPEVKLQFSFDALGQLFPNARRVSGADAVFKPYLYLAVVAFSFFLNTSVSMSLGLAQFFFLALGAMLLSTGSGFQANYLGSDKANLLRFGAYVGMAIIIVYVGRTYYAQLLRNVVGLGERGRVPGYAVWAARLLIVVFVLSVVVLTQAGLDWVMASLFVLLVLLTFLVMTRIVSETGMFFVQPYWMPVGMLTALLGIEAIGPTAYVMLALASIIILGDPRTALMPYLSNGLRMVDRTCKGSPGRLTPWLIAMLVSGFVVAGIATFSIVHQRGINTSDGWSSKILPSMVFDSLTLHLSDMSARGTLVEATQISGLERLANMHLDPEAYAWLLLGLGLLLVTAAARLRLSWWPIHPVLFLIWGTMPASRFAASFLIGAAVKSAVVRISGTRGYRTMVPFMVGIIAGEVTIGLTWIAVGSIYYFQTDMSPPTYRIFP